MKPTEKAKELLQDILRAEGINVWEDYSEQKNESIALDAMNQYAEQQAKDALTWFLKDKGKYLRVPAEEVDELFNQFKEGK